MAEFMKSSKEEVVKRGSSDTRDENSSKQQKRGDYPYEMLPGLKLAHSEYSPFRDVRSTRPKFSNNNIVSSNEDHELVAGAFGVDVEAGSRSDYDPNVEILPKEKSMKVVHEFDLNYTLPDLNETAPLEHIPIIDVVGGSNVQNDSPVMTEDLEDVVKVVRKLEIEGYILGNFRLKFLTWYSLYSTAKERDVVRTFIRTLNDDRSCLAGQLIDSFSTIINSRP